MLQTRRVRGCFGERCGKTEQRVARIGFDFELFPPAELPILIA
jgi:hypothetical protein